MLGSQRTEHIIEVFNLPPYCPELNSTERIWHYTRMQATHNRYYDTKEELCNALFLTFKTIQEKPYLINGLLKPFFSHHVVLVMRIYIERLWRTLKYECVYLYAFETGSEARKGIEEWIRRYNEERPHSSLDDRTPHEAYWNLPKAGYPVKLAA